MFWLIHSFFVSIFLAMVSVVYILYAFVSITISLSFVCNVVKWISEWKRKTLNTNQKQNQKPKRKKKHQRRQQTRQTKWKTIPEYTPTHKSTHTNTKKPWPLHKMKIIITHIHYKNKTEYCNWKWILNGNPKAVNQKRKKKQNKLYKINK